MSVVCPQCQSVSPPGSAHCTQCGAKLVATANQTTQFGMPLLRPTGGAQRGAPATAAFGEADIARLAAISRDTDEQALTPMAKPSLMAGLPRPRVSSAPSPLTATGLRDSVAPPQVGSTSSPPQPLPAQTSGGGARRTVMGMALFGPGAVSTPSPKAAPLSTAELEFANAPTGPAIATIDEFNQALAAATAPVETQPEASDSAGVESPALAAAPAVAASAPPEAAAPTPLPAPAPEFIKDATPLPTTLADDPPAASAASARTAWWVAGALLIALGALAVAFLRGA